MPDPSPAAMEAVKTLQSLDHDLPIRVDCWTGEDAVDAARIIDAVFEEQMRAEREAAGKLRAVLAQVARSRAIPSSLGDYAPDARRVRLGGWTSRKVDPPSRSPAMISRLLES